jgi:hypothetical protein
MGSSHGLHVPKVLFMSPNQLLPTKNRNNSHSLWWVGRCLFLGFGELGGYTTLHSSSMLSMYQAIAGGGKVKLGPWPRVLLSSMALK